MSDLIGITTNVGERPCRDEECPGIAELEQDGGYAFYSCPECGFEFDYRKVETPGVTESCAIGVPEEVRRAASTPMEVAQAQAEARQGFAAKWLGMGRPDNEP